MKKGINPPVCPAHKADMLLHDSRYGKFWSCPLFPGCDYKVGAHPGGQPLGFPVDQETRDLRHELHVICDQFWNWHNPREKKEMYQFLRKHTKHGHIAQMDKTELLELKELLATK
jgi:ssDNA-binding Zn-finger/Zn-ribbon topoisomerase 1